MFTPGQGQFTTVDGQLILKSRGGYINSTTQTAIKDRMTEFLLNLGLPDFQFAVGTDKNGQTHLGIGQMDRNHHFSGITSDKNPNTDLFNGPVNTIKLETSNVDYSLLTAQNIPSAGGTVANVVPFEQSPTAQSPVSLASGSSVSGSSAKEYEYTAIPVRAPMEHKPISFQPRM